MTDPTPKPLKQHSVRDILTSHDLPRRVNPDDLANRFRDERDAALARVAELEKELDALRAERLDLRDKFNRTGVAFVRAAAERDEQAKLFDQATEQLGGAITDWRKAAAERDELRECLRLAWDGVNGKLLLREHDGDRILRALREDRVAELEEDNDRLRASLDRVKVECLGLVDAIAAFNGKARENVNGKG